MIENRRRSTSKPRNWTRFAALLAVYALSFLTIRLLAGRSTGGYPTPPFFHLFFSDTIHMKAWLATGAITLATAEIRVAHDNRGHCATLDPTDVIGDGDPACDFPPPADPTTAATETTGAGGCSVTHARGRAPAAALLALAAVVGLAVRRRRP